MKTEPQTANPESFFRAVRRPPVFLYSKPIFRRDGDVYLREQPRPTLRKGVSPRELTEAEIQTLCNSLRDECPAINEFFDKYGATRFEIEIRGGAFFGLTVLEMRTVICAQG